jgi:hypothetical protein
MNASIRAFPWERLPRIERAAVRARRELTKRVVAGIDRAGLSGALGQRLGVDA